MMKIRDKSGIRWMWGFCEAYRWNVLQAVQQTGLELRRENWPEDSGSEPRASYMRPDEPLDLSSHLGWPQGKRGSLCCQGGIQGGIHGGSIWSLGEKDGMLGKPRGPPLEQNCHQRKPTINWKILTKLCYFIFLHCFTILNEHIDD